MHTGLLHTHRLFFYVAFALVLFTFVRSLLGLIGKKHFSKSDVKLTLFTTIALHIQLVVGFVLYFVSPVVKAGFKDFGLAMKTEGLRFFLVEHPLMMIVAIILATIARSKIKKKTDGSSKYKIATVLYLFTLIALIASVPWDRVL